MSCAHLAAQPNFMSHIWEAEWCHLYNLGLKFQNPGQNFLLSLSPTTDSFTPELKTNEEQKPAVAVLIITCSPISLLKKFLRYNFLMRTNFFQWPHHIACRIFSWACKPLVVACRIQFPDKGWNPSPFALGAQSLSYWTTRGVLDPLFLDCFPFMPAVPSSLKIINN